MSQERAAEVERDNGSVQSDILRIETLKWIPIINIGVLLIGAGISFLIAFFNESVTGYLPFISETGAHIPEMFVFSLTLYFGAVIGVAIVIFQFIIFKCRLSSQQTRLINMNKTTTICGFISMIGLAGVAAVPMSTVLWVHLVFAGIHFTFALIYAYCVTFIIYFIPGGDTRINRMRMVLCVLLLAIIISLVVIFPLAQFKWFKVNQKLPALKTPEDKFFELMLASTALEWLTYAVYLTILGSLFFEFQKYEFVVSVSPINVRPRETETEN